MYHYYSTPGEESTFDCPEDVEKNIENLINELKVEGKVMLACAWTTLDESRRFKIHPWVCMMWMQNYQSLLTILMINHSIDHGSGFKE